ncbi:TraI/MobA(P) family conjugative relaxase [Candidatus Williamhamiltonella defendens]|uniref:TraI/MobA(P) family conjugative relaxase n=1 Tax=Candidatus Williamhamiltonella defendens TaxID=138072 RepID=UPI001F1FFB29|nr:TraI/MobA(P) family conjugative relaxase [Candidatus Hamiltonella defensa]
MVVVIPKKRRDGKSSFLKLVSYLSFREDNPGDIPVTADAFFDRPSTSKTATFDRLIDYIDRHASPESQHLITHLPDGSHRILCEGVLCQTNTLSIETASSEMNAVASNNRRCLDPVYHFILSWPEEETPEASQVFDSALFCLKEMGMVDHQYVFAIHRDTDNLHCHVAANRIHPLSYRAVNLYNDVKILHKACRKLELKYDWKPDNGCWKRDQNHQIIRAESQYPSAPRAATQFEYHEDKESFYSYVVRTCRTELTSILKGPLQEWEEAHAVFLRAHLELKKKGSGLAIYDKNCPNNVPLKASSLHPQLTLSKLVPRIGEFESAPRVMEFKNEQGEVTLTNYMVSSHYDDRLHLRDHQARMTRRLERAEAREELKLRYQTDKKEAKCPSFDAKNRFRTLSMTFRFRRAHVCVAVRDPLMRKLAWHVLAFEREKAMAELRLKLKEERENWYRAPENRRLSYRVWVEQQALKGDKAAISQLRGWAYQAKRDERTAYLSDTVIECAVSDDIAPVELKGYTHHIHRDGAIVYKKEGITQMIDRGETIEMARPFENEGTIWWRGYIWQSKKVERNGFSRVRGSTLRKRVRWFEISMKWAKLP